MNKIIYDMGPKPEISIFMCQNSIKCQCYSTIDIEIKTYWMHGFKK